MKYLICLLFLLPQLVAAQCYGSFEFFGAAGVSDTDNSFLNELITTQPVMAYRMGFGASFRVGERTYLRTGVQFSQYGSDLSGGRNLRFGTQHDGMGGFDPTAASGDPGLDLDLRERHFYGEAFAGLRYQFKTWSNWQPFVEGGLGLSQYGTTATAERSQPLANFKTINVLGRLGAGTNYNFNDSFGLYAMVVGQRFLSNQTTLTTGRVHSWQATLEVGVRVFVDPR